jgi:hypothetical protein
MAQIFISYRRADSGKDCGRIYEHLIECFGAEAVYRDFQSTAKGVDYRQHIQRAVNQCDVALVLIGPRWLNIAYENGTRRLGDPHDLVRIEVEIALSRPECRVIPVLLQGASIPAERDLPPSLRPLAFRNAAQVRDDPDFANDMAALMNAIGPCQPAAGATAAQPPSKQGINITGGQVGGVITGGNMGDVTFGNMKQNSMIIQKRK